MNEAACNVILNLINLAVRMMPIFVCLEPKEEPGEHCGRIGISLGHYGLPPVPVSHQGTGVSLCPGNLFLSLFFAAPYIF